jgi:hypothetical protein
VEEIIFFQDGRCSRGVLATAYREDMGASGSDGATQNGDASRQANGGSSAVGFSLSFSMSKGSGKRPAAASLNVQPKVEFRLAGSVLRSSVCVEICGAQSDSYGHISQN